MFKEIKNAVAALMLFTLITGIAYPLAVTGVAQVVFRDKANGSLLPDNRGSVLIGQPFDDPRYFWGRLSATSPTPYNAASSGGSNYAPTNPALVDAARSRIDALKAADPGYDKRVPVDLVTASASGLDPHISLTAADYQTARVARARGVGVEALRRIIAARAERPTLGLLGEPRVNVLRLNMDLDGL